jgi:hypothetical protein
MIEKLSIPAFIFKPIYSKNITVETIKRQDDILEIDFPVFEKEDVMNFANQLAMRRRKAHDRPIDELLEILDIVGTNWLNPNYEFRKEALEIIPMMTGQSRKLCELELNGSISIYLKKVAETFLKNEIGGKDFLEKWVPKGNIKLHAQPRGVLYHNLAGNAFNVGLISLFYGMISKNVNLIKLPHEEPYYSVRLAQSIAEVDKKLAKEMAILYWAGHRSDIFDDLFGSGNVDAIICWGGLRSIEDIRKRSWRYGIKLIDHGPKLSFSLISDEILKDPVRLKDATNKIATDIVFWNQKACLSPRVIYILEEDIKNTINIKKTSEKSKTDVISNMLSPSGSPIGLKKNGVETNLAGLMQRSAKLLRNEMTDVSPYGFAKMLAEQMEQVDKVLPRAHLTEADGMEMVKKREYFTLKYELNKNGKIITPSNNALDWTVVYLRNPPTFREFEMCYNRIVIVTRLANYQDLVHFIRSQQLNKYLQTISLFGSNEFVEKMADEFSLLGACRFPRMGEHNIQDMGAPWDGHFILQNLLRWSFIGFQSQDKTAEEAASQLNLKSSEL